MPMAEPSGGGRWEVGSGHRSLFTDRREGPWVKTVGACDIDDWVERRPGKETEKKPRM